MRARWDRKVQRDHRDHAEIKAYRELLDHRGQQDQEENRVLEHASCAARDWTMKVEQR